MTKNYSTGSTHFLQLSTIVVLFTLSCIPLQSHAQRSIEVYGGVGSTLVDVEKLAGGTLADWETFASGYSIQAFIVGNESVSVGVEYGYTYLLFYTFLVGQSFFETEVEASRAMLMSRFYLKKNILFEGGAGAYFFDGVNDLAIGIGGGYRFPITESLSIPLKLRTDIVFTENTTMFPVTVNGGLSYTF